MYFSIITINGIPSPRHPDLYVLILLLEKDIWENIEDITWIYVYNRQVFNLIKFPR